MNSLAQGTLLSGPLAVHPLLDSIRDTLTSGPKNAESVAFIVGVVAFVLLVVVAARVFGRERGAAAQHQVDYLTIAVDVLGLSESERRDLQKIARRAGLQQPVAMLLSPANLAQAAAAAEIEHDPHFRPWLDELCQRLFETPLPDPQEPPGQPS